MHPEENLGDLITTNRLETPRKWMLAVFFWGAFHVASLDSGEKIYYIIRVFLKQMESKNTEMTGLDATPPQML